MKNKYKSSLFIRFWGLIFLLFSHQIIWAQVPTFYTGNMNSPSNSYPFATTTGRSMQSLIAPTEFIGGTGPYFGNITKFYVQGTALNTSTYTNLTIKMGQITPTTLPTGTIVTPLTTVYTAPTTVLSSTAAGWIMITLQTPFLFDPSRSLVVEINQCASTGGFSVTNVSKPGFRRTYNSSGCTMTYAGQDGNLFNCGIDLVSAGNNDIGITSISSPGQFCSPGSLPVIATLRNFGMNQVTGATVNWSVNGVTQTPYSFTGLLDTLNGSGSTTANIPLGSYTFPANQVLIKVWSSSPNSVPDTIPLNDTAQAVKAPSISGNYTINPSGTGTNNFTSFDSAIIAMNSKGLCGPIVFTVAPGTYTNQVIIQDVVGSSPVNTITFDGVNPSLCIINGSYSAQGTVILNNSKYVTFKNFTVANTSSGNCAGIAVVGSTNKITLFNNRINLPIQTGTSSSGFGIIATGTVNGGGTSAQTGDSLLIDSNIITGGGYGIVVYGASNANVNRGIQITDNMVFSANYMGGYIAYNYNPINLIKNTFNVVGQNYGYYGLYFYNNMSSNTSISHQIYGNAVNNFSYYGMYIVSPLLNSSAAPFKFYNNIIQSASSGYTLTQYGVYLSLPASSNGWIYHNSIVLNMSSTSTTSTCFYNTGSSNVLIKNNIFYFVGASGSPLYTNTAVTGNKINYNNYYNATNPTSGNLVYNGGNWNLSTFQTNARGGDSSFSVKPSFISLNPIPGNLHLSDGCDGKGVDLTSEVPEDMDGVARSITPNPGADEYTGIIANNLKYVELLSPSIPVAAGTQDLRFTVKNIGSNVITGYSASYRLAANTPVTVVKTNSVGLCVLDTILFTGANQITIGPINQLTLYSSLPNANPDGEPNNDTSRITLFTPLNGIYTVGGINPDFVDIKSAASALQFGVSGNVKFDIRPGTYTGQVIVNGPIVGASDSSRITFEGNSNVNRILTADVGAAALLINQASYVSVQNLRVNNTFNGTCAGIGVIGSGSNSNASKVYLIKNDIHIPILNGTSSAGYGITYTATTGGVGNSAMRADSSIIDSNTITGGGYGIVHYGSSNTSYNRGIRIRGNLVNNCNAYGSYIYNNYNPIIYSGNTINMQSQNYGYYGVYFYSNRSSSTSISHEIIGNKVNDFGGYGIYVYYPLGSTSAAKVKIYNNSVIGGSGSNYPGYYGIYLYQYNSSCNADVYHNTIVMNNSSATSTTYSGFYNTGSSATNVKNNIFAVYAGSYTPMYLATNLTGNRVNYNNYYNGTNILTGTLLYRGGNYTPANYLSATAGGDTSYNYAPVFTNLSGFDLHLTNACTQRGFDLTSDVPVDIDNQIRSISPQIGSDEAVSGTLDLSIDALISPSFPVDSGYQNVAVRVRNNGSTVVTSFGMNYKMNSGAIVTQSYFGSLNPCDTVTMIFSGVQQVYVPFNVSNTLKVFTSAPNAGIDNNPANDTLISLVSTPLAGNYIIGTTAASDYPTFNSAISALQLRGVSGPVVFQVRTGIYTESFSLPNIIGSSPLNTITFKSMANQVDSVVVLPATTDPYIVRLNQATNSIFRKITFQSNATSSLQNGFNLIGPIQNDSIVDCKINMAFQTSYGNYLIYGTGLNNYFDNFVVQNNVLLGSYNGIYLYGSGNSYLGKFRNVTISGNEISNTYNYSFYSYYSSNLTFNRNVISPSSLYSGNINYFMYADSMRITNNKWNLTNNATMYLGYYSYNSPDRRGLVANNVITGVGNVSSPNIYMGYNCQYLDVINNSFSFPSSTQCAYIYNTGATGMRLKNNVFHNRGTGSAAYFAANPIANVEANYNNYFTTGPILFSGVSSQTTMAGWKAYSNQDKLSWNYEPGFTSFTDLTPSASNPNAWSLNGRAEIFTGVSTDITGAPRPTSVSNGVPDVGAYEFTPTSTPPLATAVPSTPVAGGTQAFLFGGDTIAKITYDPFATAPSSMNVRLYSGVTPPLIAPATAYPYFYLKAEGPAGSYYYNFAINYKPIWLGTLPTLADLRLATKAPANSWIVLTGANSTVDTLNYTITGNAPLIDIPAIFTAADDLNPLPVDLIKFSGKKIEKSVVLNWATASEKNSQYFEVERSYDGTHFNLIGNVKSNGNSNSLKNYSLLDPIAFMNNDPVVYYRLKMVDLDGSMEYSQTVTITNTEDGSQSEMVHVFPNPFAGNLFIEYKASPGETIELRDLSGRKVHTQILDENVQVHQLSISQELEKGIYILNFGANKNKSVKLIRD